MSAARSVRCLIALVVLSLSAIVVLGCGGGDSSSGAATDEAAAQPGGVLHVAQLAEPTTLNPSAMYEIPAIEVSGQINEPLYRMDESGKIVPLLATGFKRSADGLTWTVSLRKGVTFSDGKPLTSADVVFSIEAARKSSIWAGLWEEVESVAAPSPGKVEIKTKKPMPALEALLSSYSGAVVPDNYGGASEKEFAQHPVGSGPFELKAWRRGQSVTLVKNPHFREKGLPLADEVVFTAVPDDNSRLSQFRAGEVDVIGQPTFTQLQSLEASPTAHVHEYGQAFVDLISLNVSKPLFKNMKVREAINLAVDREGIIKAALGGYGEPGGSFLPPLMTPYFDSSIKAPAQNLAKAKKLLGEAVQEGADPSFTLMTFAGQAYSGPASQIIQQDLTEVGFSVKLQPLDEAAWIENWVTGENEAALGGWIAGIPDPSEIANFYIGEVAKTNGMDVSALEATAAEANTELDLSKREALYAKMQEEVASDLQVIILDYQPTVWATQADVAGFEATPMNAIWLNRTGFSE